MSAHTEKKILPHNQDAEQGLLGCLLVSNDCYDDIQLSAENFFMPAHKRLFEEIEKCIRIGRNATPVTLKNTFENDPDLNEVGGAEYLVDLAASVVSLVNVRDYAETIKELYRRRELIVVAEDIISSAYSYDVSEKGKILESAEKSITSIVDENPSMNYTASQAVHEAVRWMVDIKEGRIKPTLTGYKGLDERLTGFYPAGLYIIAGRPGMGKTALMLNLADNISTYQPALIISLEMRAQELGMRLISTYTEISVEQQRQPHTLDMMHWDAIKQCQTNLENKKLYIEDASKANLSYLISAARRHKRKYGEYVLFIDYLGLIETDKRIHNKVHQIEEITTSLKALAKELSIPIVLLSQLSRSVEQRDDKRPIISDLRDSGAIEQDADVILFPYRPEYYKSREKPEKGKLSEARYQEMLADWNAEMEQCKGQAEIIIAKNRQGQTGSVPMQFNGAKQRFEG